MKITLAAGPHEYRNCPVKARLENADIRYGEASLVREDGSRLPCQVFSECGSDYVAWIEPRLGPAETRTYRLDWEPVGAGESVQVTDVGDGTLEVTIKGELFTRYYYGERWPRPFLYPFVGPGGASVTRHYPMREDVPGEKHDHPHHRSVWIAYGEVNGTDNWSENPGHAWIRHRKFEEITSGPIFGRFRSVNDWVGSDGAKQMEDVREFTFYNCQAERIVDVYIRFIGSDGDVYLGDTKEGGVLSIRVASSMDGDRGGLIVNSRGGATEAHTWGKPAEWVDYSGPVGDKTMGITVMDSPTSFRYPSRWHVRDYGLFTANPFALKYYEPDKGVNGDHTIPKGGEIAFKYRVYVHEGNAEQAAVAARYDDFVSPPCVEVHPH